MIRNKLNIRQTENCLLDRRGGEAKTCLGRGALFATSIFSLLFGGFCAVKAEDATTKEAGYSEFFEEPIEGEEGTTIEGLQSLSSMAFETPNPSFLDEVHVLYTDEELKRIYDTI